MIRNENAFTFEEFESLLSENKSNPFGQSTDNPPDSIDKNEKGKYGYMKHGHNIENDEPEMDEYKSDNGNSQEYDVEHYTINISDQTIKMRACAFKDPGGRTWLEKVETRCTHDGKDIGTVVGQLIHRSKIASRFLKEMTIPSQEVADIVFELFDRYGSLKPKFKNGSQRGTGVWGDELDRGPLLLIEHVR